MNIYRLPYWEQGTFNVHKYMHETMIVGSVGATALVLAYVDVNSSKGEYAAYQSTFHVDKDTLSAAQHTLKADGERRQTVSDSQHQSDSMAVQSAKKALTTVTAKTPERISSTQQLGTEAGIPIIAMAVVTALFVFARKKKLELFD